MVTPAMYWKTMMDCLRVRPNELSLTYYRARLQRERVGHNMQVIRMNKELGAWWPNSGYVRSSVYSLHTTLYRTVAGVLLFHYSRTGSSNVAEAWRLSRFGGRFN